MSRGLLNGLGQQQAPQMVIAQPINDIQLIALAAAQLYPHMGDNPVQNAVSRAVDLVAEAVVQGQNLPNLIRQKRQALEI